MLRIFFYFPPFLPRSITLISLSVFPQMLGENPKEYNGLVMFTEGMKGLFSDVTKVKVLDVGAGTGLSGEKVRRHARE